MAIKKTVKEVLLYSNDEESYYVLPSGFEGKVILVNESPVDLTVRHAAPSEIDAMFGGDKEATA